MKRVFVDSGAFFAGLIPEDASTYSLCDALSFVAMERLGIGEALAYDRHFREYGRFVIL